jgi:ribosomal protein S6
LAPYDSLNDHNSFVKPFFVLHTNQAIVASGGMGLEVFNRGMMPLAYNIKRKDMGGITNRYLDGVFLLFNFCAKPKAIEDLQKKFNVDDDVIRSTTFRVIPPPASIARNILKKQRRAEKRKEASEGSV